MSTVFFRARRPSILVFAMTACCVLAACSENDTRAESAPAGQSLFKLQACVTCHGDHGQGTMLGPALTDAHSNWTREKLSEYLADPQGYAAKDPRLAKQGKGYFQPMPSYKLLKPEERTSLADYVLGLR